MTSNDKFVDKIGLADLLNLDEMIAEDEAKHKKQRKKKESGK